MSPHTGHQDSITLPAFLWWWHDSTGIAVRGSGNRILVFTPEIFPYVEPEDVTADGGHEEPEVDAAALNDAVEVSIAPSGTFTLPSALYNHLGHTNASHTLVFADIRPSIEIYSEPEHQCRYAAPRCQRCATPEMSEALSRLDSGSCNTTRRSQLEGETQWLIWLADDIRGKGFYVPAIRYYLDALEIARIARSNGFVDEHWCKKVIAMACNQIGICYSQWGKVPQALENFNDAIDYAPDAASSMAVQRNLDRLRDKVRAQGREDLL